MSAIYKEPLSVLKRLLFVAMVVLGMTVATTSVQAAGIISGTVYNDVNDNLAFNTGIDYTIGAGATVALQTTAGVELATATTNASGVYTFPARPAGNYKILVKAAPTGYVTVGTEVKTILVTSVADNPNNNLAIRGSGGSISGRVFDDQDRNIAFGGTDINKTNVRVYLKKGGVTISTVTTTSTGYSFKNLPNDAYTVEVENSDLDNENLSLVSSSDGVVDTPKRVITIPTLTSALTNKNFAATEVNASGVDGIVVVDMNGDNAYVAGDDVLLAGATVQLYYNDGTTLVPGVVMTPSPTGTNGKYQIKNIPLWKYKVKVTPTAGYLSTGSKDGTTGDAKSTIALDMTNPSAPYALYNFYVEGDSSSALVTGMTGSVFGRTVGGYSGGAGPDAGGTQNNGPIAGDTLFQGVTVQLYQGATLYLTQVTKADGSYSFKGLPAGAYTVKINTSAIPSSFKFVNDSDGKSSNPLAVHGGNRAPLEITRTLVAGTTQAAQNFWFGEAKSNLMLNTRMNTISNSYPWGGTVNRVPSGGGPGYGSYELYEEDGVTLISAYTSGAVLLNGPIIYKLVAASYPTDLVPQWTALRTVPFPNRNWYDSIAFNGGRNFTGKVFIDTNNNGIFDGADKPIYGATIRAYNEDASIQWGVTGSALDGTFNFTQLPPRKARFAVTDLNYADNGVNGQVVFAGDVDGVATNYIIVDLTGGNQSGQNTWFKSKNTTFYIKGSTWIDTYTNGTLQTTGVNGTADSALNGVTVELWNGAGSTLLATQPSDTSGNFKFDNLSANTTYQVKASKANLTVITTSGNESAGGATRTITFGADPGVYADQQFLFKGPGKISGNSWNDVNGDQLNNGNANESWPGGEHTYTLSQNRGGVWTQIAWRGNSGTSFNFDALEPGDYRVTTSFSVISQRYPDPGLYGRIDLTIPVTGTQQFTDANFIERWASTGNLAGSVYLDSNNNGVIDAGDIKLINLPATTQVELRPTARFYPTYNTVAQTAAALATPWASAPVSAVGDFSFTKPNSMNYLVTLAGLPADYILVTDIDGTAPSDTYLPASLQGNGTIKATMVRPGIANQNFLVKRSVPSLISGRVFYDIDYDNNFVLTEDTGITGQTIELWDGATLIATTAVDSGGAYKFENILNGTYTVKLVAGNIPADMVVAPMSASAAAIANRTMTVSNADAQFGDVNFWYNKSGQSGIAGVVYVDMDNDGLPNLVGDYPISGATVNLKKGSAIVKTTTTNSRGAYKFTEIAQDNYTVELVVPTGYTVYKTSAGNTTIPSITVNMTSASMFTGRYFLLAGNTNSGPGTGPGGSGSLNSGVSGYLYKGNTITPPTGNRLAGVSLSLYDGATLLGHAVTDATGKYQFLNLPAKAYTVTLDATPSGLSIVGDADMAAPLGNINVTLVANSGKANQNIWFAENSPAGIAGKVTYSGKGQTAADPLDVPVKDITVELYDANNLTSPMYSMTTDGDGNYQFENIPTISYQIKVKATDKTTKGYKDLTPSTGIITVTNMPVAGLTNQNFLLGGLRTLSGKIQKDIDGDGVVDLPISNVDTTLLWAGPDGAFGTADDVKYGSVAAAGSATVVAGKTDGNGQYTYTNLPQGDYQVGYSTTNSALAGLTMIPVAVLPANTAPPRTVALTVDKSDVNFAYEPLSTLEGTIRYDLNGDGIYNDTLPTIDPGIGGLTLTLYKENPAAPGTYVLVPGKTATTSLLSATAGYFKFEDLSYGKYYVQIDKTKIPNYSVIWTGQDGNTANDRVYGTLSATAASKIKWHALYGAGAGKVATVKIETRSDSDNSISYTPADAMFGGVPVTVYAKDGAANLFFGTVVTNSAGVVNVKLPYGIYTFVADEASGLTGQATAVYDNDGVPFGTVSNKDIQVANDTIYFGYKSNESGGLNTTLSGNVSIGASYVASNPDLDGVVLQLFRKTTVNGVSGYVYVKDATTGVSAPGDYSFTGLKGGDYQIRASFMATNPAYKIVSGYNNTTTEIKDITVSAATVNNMVYNLDPTKSRLVTFQTLMDDLLDGKRAGDATPAQNIVIQITGGGLTNYEITTSNLGTKTFALADGTYTIKVKNGTSPADELIAVYNTTGDNLADPGARTFSFTTIASDTKVAFFGFKKASNPSSGTDKTISGRVVDLANLTSYQATDAGLNNVKVLLEQEIGAAGSGNWAPVASYSALGNGTYTTGAMPINKNYRVSIVAATAPANRTLKVPATPGTTAGQLTSAGITNWHFGYIPAGGVPAGTFQDMTFTSRNDNGTSEDNYDVADALLSNVAISLRNTAGTYVIDPSQGVKTSAGVYTFKNLPQDTYTLTFVVPTKMTRAYKYIDGVKDITNTNTISFTVDAAPPAPVLLAGFKATLVAGSYELGGKVVYDNGTTVGSLDVEDLPINGVGLVLAVYDTGTSTFIETSKTATTDATGAYKFTGLGNDRYQVIVKSGIDSKFKVSFDGDVTLDGKREVILNNASVTTADFGYIGDKTTYPNDFKSLTIETRSTTDPLYQTTDPFLANVGIQLTPPSGSTLVFPAKTTGTTGKYTYKDLPIGAYKIDAASMSGYNLVYASKTLTINQITSTLTTASVSPVTEYFGYQLDISGTGEIKGRVVYDTDANNNYTATDLGIVGVPVKLQYDPGTGTGFQDTGKTDTTKIAASGVLEGEYKFNGIKLDGTGTYRVVVDNTSVLISPLTVVWDTDGIGGTKDHNIAGALTANEASWHFVYKASGAGGTNLTLQTRFDTNDNNAYDVTDAAEGSVTVRVVGQGINTTVQTNSITGNVVLNGVPTGTYTLTVTPPTGLAVTYHTSGASTLVAQSFTASSGTSTARFGFEIDIAGKTKRTLSGRVVLDSNANNHYELTDAGIKNAQIKVEYRISTGPDEYRIYPIGGTSAPILTAANGVISLANMAEGHYRISVVGGVPSGAQIKFVGGEDGQLNSTPSTTAVIERDLDSTPVSQTTWNYGYSMGDASNLTVNVRFDSNFNSAVAGTESDGKDPHQAGVPVTVTDGTITHTFTSNGSPKLLSNMPYGTYTISVNLTGTNYTIAYDPLTGTANSVSFTSSSTSKIADYGVKVKLAPPGTGKTITGRVILDSDTNYAGTESGLNGIKASIYQQNGADWLLVHPAATTAGTGAYSFTDLIAGQTYKVVVDTAMAPKYTKVGAAAGAGNPLVTVISKVVTADETWINAFSGQYFLEGYVSFDTERTGTFKPTLDIMMNGVVVKADAIINGTPVTVYSVATLADGKYRIEGLPEGVWTASIHNFGSTFTGTYDYSYVDTNKNTLDSSGDVVNTYTTYTATVGLGLPNSEHNFGMYGDGKIEGKMLIDANGTGIYDPNDENFVLTVPTYIKVSDQNTASTFIPYYIRTKADGSFTIKYLIPGFTYRFEANTGTPPVGPQVFVAPTNPLKTSYYGENSGTLAHVAVGSNIALNRSTPAASGVPFNITDARVGFRSAYTVDGHLVIDVNANGVYDPGIDIPLDGETVLAKANDTAAGIMDATTTTGPSPVVGDPAGFYQFTGLAGPYIGDGKWNIKVGPSTLLSGMNLSFESSDNVIDNNQLVDLATGNKTNINFGYTGKASITGTVQKVIGTSDLPLGNVIVELYDNNNHLLKNTTTDNTGAYSFTNLSNHNITGVDYVVKVKMAQPTLTPMTYVSGLTTESANVVYKEDVTFTDHTALDIATPTIFKVKPHTSYEVAGFVFRDSNDDGQVTTSDPTEVAVPGEVITVRDSANVIVGTPAIGADGSYSLLGLPAGQYTLTVTGVPSTYVASFDPNDAHAKKVLPATPNVATINLGAPMTNLNFGYIMSGTAKVVVRNVLSGSYTTSEPGLANAEVEVREGILTNPILDSGVTDSQGFITFRNLDTTKTYIFAVPFGTPENTNTLSPLQQVEFVTAGTTTTGTVPSPGDMNGVAAISEVFGGGNTITDAQVYFGFTFNNYKVTVTKRALKDSAHIGEFVPYKVTVTSNESKPIPGMTLKDLIPAGFKYVNDSGRIIHKDASGVVIASGKIGSTGNRPIEFALGTMNQGDVITLNYILVVGSGVTPGEYINKAHTVTLAGFQNSNVAQATVKVTGDPLFDDSLIFGKVFWDKNRDGRQDKDEPGVGGVKLITARGEIITTDESGRYHLADVSGGRWERGTNFILKLDVRRLPQGLTTTTENPIVTRLSLGLPSRINFGVEVPPPVAARLSEQLALAKAEEVKKIEEKLLKEEKFVVESIHFAFDKEQIEAEFENTLDSLAEVLRLHPEWKIRIEGHTDSLGTEAYNKELSQRRANAVKAYLLKTGVNSSQLVDAVGLGLSEPVGDNGTPEGRYKNRRVEFKLEK